MRLDEIKSLRTYVARLDKPVHDEFIESEGLEPIDCISSPGNRYYIYIWANTMQQAYSIDAGAEFSPDQLILENQLNELSDKRLKKYVKKATKSADALQYYSDSRTDPDWEKSQKRKKMVDVAKGKLAKTNETKASDAVVFAGEPFSVIRDEDGLYELIGLGQAGVFRYHDLKHAVEQCKFENKAVRKRYKTPAEFKASFGIKESIDKQEVIDSLAERIAAKYKANEYEEFEREMLALLPKELKPLADLPQLFDLYNPHRQREGGEIWARMLKNPERYLK